MTTLSETSGPKGATLAPLIDPYREKIEEALKVALTQAGSLPMYGMLRYFLGHVDEQFVPRDFAAGKRIRPALCLYMNAAFGGSSNALDLAVAIELFHNFTLIHDDIEDRDTMRRGRKTVWNVWGVNHAINAGDAQSLLATRYLMKAALADPERGGLAVNLLEQKFMEVTEGQYLDFELSLMSLDDPRVTMDAYLEMVRKKTSVLVGGAVAAGGIAAGCDAAVANRLYEFGESLGIAYQMADDMASVWGEEGATGKQAYGDLYERKKTFPILHAAADPNEGAALCALYADSKPFTQEDVQKMIALLDRTAAHEATKARAMTYVEKARACVRELPISDEYKAALAGIVNAFVRFPHHA